MKLEVNDEVKSMEGVMLKEIKKSQEAVIKKQSGFLAERTSGFHPPSPILK